MLPEVKPITKNGIIPFTLIPRVTVNKIMVDSKGYLWFTTPENGIYVVNSNSDKIVMQFSDEGEDAYKLPERGVSSVLEFDDSTIIITTATHVLRFNPVQEKRSLSDPRESYPDLLLRLKRTNRDTSGLPVPMVSTGLIFKQKKIFVIQPFGWYRKRTFYPIGLLVLPDGRMIFGTTNHFISLIRTRIRRNSTCPISELQILK